MSRVPDAGWTPWRRDLWERIAAHALDGSGAAPDLVGRLAGDRGWTDPVARAAIEEYRRFCFLAMVSPRPVTPSEEVDEVWHAHLTCSRHYWDRWCPVVLGAPLHHDPARGGPGDLDRHREQYAETLDLYEAYFGRPPDRFWPPTHTRFRARPRFRTIDGDRHFIVRRPLPPPRWPGAGRALLRGCMLVLGLIVSGHAAAVAMDGSVNPLDWEPEPFLDLYGGLCVISLALLVWLRDRVRDAGAGATGDGLGAIDLAYLAGGPKRAADSLIIALIGAGAASLDPRYGRIFIEPDGPPVPDDIRPFRDRLSGMLDRRAVERLIAPGLAAVGDSLARRGLVPTEWMLRRIGLWALFLVAPVLLFGLVRTANGVWHGRAVGYLVVLMLLTAAAAAWLAIRGPRRTSGGDRVLAEARKRHRRVTRAPERDEIALAAALVGPVIVERLGLPGFAGFLAPYPAGNGAAWWGGATCGGGGGGGGGGCGGGGHGCGGCGGG